MGWLDRIVQCLLVITILLITDNTKATVHVARAANLRSAAKKQFTGHCEDIAVYITRGVAYPQPNKLVYKSMLTVNNISHELLCTTTRHQIKRFVFCVL